MPQDRDSGAEGAAYGHMMGTAICLLIGAHKQAAGSNEVVWCGKRAVIKSCGARTSSFGITTSMLERLDVALVAIERTDGGVGVFELPIERFKAGMHDSLSGRANGAVKKLRRSDAESHGRLIATFTAGQITEAHASQESMASSERVYNDNGSAEIDHGRHRATLRHASQERSPMKIATDGLDALRTEIGLAKIASLIERTARWVSPSTFWLMPVWFPEHARGEKFYKANWSEPQHNTTRATGARVHKAEGNTYANMALSLALGLRKADRPNWSCCHIWGIDDPRYQAANSVVKDRRFYSCVGNMVLLPTPLKAFTDTMPEVKAMLRLCARNLYLWSCDHEELGEVNQQLDMWDAWEAYPETWPRRPRDRLPMGVVELTPRIVDLAMRRKEAIDRDLAGAGEHYPKKEVLAVLEYWKNAARKGLWPDPSRFAGSADDIVPLCEELR